MKKLVFISPHLDDAILSCGEYIKKMTDLGNEVNVITVFSGCPNKEEFSGIAKAFHKLCNLADNAMDIRKLEDIRAIKKLNCSYEHLDEYECLYRVGDNGEFLINEKKDILSDQTLMDKKTIESLTNTIGEKIFDIRFDEIYVPLSVGNHTDHILIRKVLENILIPNYIDKLYYYQDTPYIFYDKFPVEEKTKGLKNVVVEINEKEWQSKIEAINEYDSQLKMLWPNENDMITQLDHISKKYLNDSRSIMFWIK